MGRGTGGPNAPSLYGDGRWRHPRMCPDHVARGQGRGCGLQVVLARDGGGRRIDRTLGQRPRDNRRRRGNVKTQREGERRERERFPSHYNASLSRPPTPSCRPPHTSSPGQQPNASAVGSRGAMRREAGTSETGTAGDHCFRACDSVHPLQCSQSVVEMFVFLRRFLHPYTGTPHAHTAVARPVSRILDDRGPKPWLGWNGRVANQRKRGQNEVLFL